ncbi:hypothetical protein M011DRAFT_322275 [Sporormia fimetaria CBS 119925]|uniref:Uncharacterized protein n=1 Tax=Sporormia fimetaria CBS 119925 TaxID=1340428 RepID=A0A6A6VGU5_9PLEO|nr:hypothetical protein M011DRAFT_322275 [Sporormia fimetaria CBS 119925]
MLFSVLPTLALLTAALAAPTPAPAGAAATTAKIRGVRDPIYHLYLQANPKNATVPVLGPESTGESFTIANPGSIQSVKTSAYLNIVNATTSYKPVAFGTTAETTAWGLEGDTVITVQGSSWGRQLNWLVCRSNDAGYYDLYLQTGSETPSGRSCSNYQTIHLPCLC